MDGSLKKLKVNGQHETVYKRARRAAHAAASETPPESRVPRTLRALDTERRRLVRRIEKAGTLIDLSRETVTLRLSGPQSLPKLPRGYYFKGGAAREVLRAVVTPGVRAMHLCDYDLVRFSGSDDRHDHELALRYMGADYEFGHGVEVAESKEIYFKTRDLTVNEVLYHDAHLECSFTALADALTGRMRPTAYIRNTMPHMQARTLMKAIRLAAEGLVLDVPLTLCEFSETIAPTPFDIALHLNRALAAGVVVAEEYLFHAWKHGVLLPERGAPPPLVEAIAFLGQRLARGAAFFSHLPAELPAG